MRCSRSAGEPPGTRASEDWSRDPRHIGRDVVGVDFNEFDKLRSDHNGLLWDGWHARRDIIGVTMANDVPWLHRPGGTKSARFDGPRGQLNSGKFPRRARKFAAQIR